MNYYLKSNSTKSIYTLSKNLFYDMIQHMGGVCGFGNKQKNMKLPKEANCNYIYIKMLENIIDIIIFYMITHT